MKAVRKEPQDRYRSADQLNDDILNYLEGRPVVARSGNFTYLAGKFIRRYRLPVAAASVALVAIVAGLVITLMALRAANISAQEYAKKRIELELVAAATDYRQRQPAEVCRKQIEAAAGPAYGRLREAHAV